MDRYVLVTFRDTRFELSHTGSGASVNGQLTVPTSRKTGSFAREIVLAPWPCVRWLVGHSKRDPKVPVPCNFAVNLLSRTIRRDNKIIAE